VVELRGRASAERIHPTGKQRAPGVVLSHGQDEHVSDQVVERVQAAKQLGTKVNVPSVVIIDERVQDATRRGRS